MCGRTTRFQASSAGYRIPGNFLSNGVERFVLFRKGETHQTAAEGRIPKRRNWNRARFRHRFHQSTLPRKSPRSIPIWWDTTKTASPHRLKYHSLAPMLLNEAKEAERKGREAGTAESAAGGSHSTPAGAESEAGGSPCRAGDANGLCLVATEQEIAYDAAGDFVWRGPYTETSLDTTSGSKVCSAEVHPEPPQHGMPSVWRCPQPLPLVVAQRLRLSKTPGWR
jgi:hypothetical protein